VETGNAAFPSLLEAQGSRRPVLSTPLKYRTRRKHPSCGGVIKSVGLEEYYPSYNDIDSGYGIMLLTTPSIPK
jgi:hypothetical protein